MKYYARAVRQGPARHRLSQKEVRGGAVIHRREWHVPDVPLLPCRSGSAGRWRQAGPSGDRSGRRRLPVEVVRKERSVGVVPLVPTIYEVLEELAITVQSQLTDRLPLPFCAFNGGADVFCDLGNKCACAASPPSCCWSCSFSTPRCLTPSRMSSVLVQRVSPSIVSCSSCHNRVLCLSRMSLVLSTSLGLPLRNCACSGCFRGMQVSGAGGALELPGCTPPARGRSCPSLPAGPAPAP